MRTIVKGDTVQPQYHYCSNCGSSEFNLEKLDKINFIDINFAVLKRRVVSDSETKQTFTQCWEERTFEQPKLLGLFR